MKIKDILLTFIMCLFIIIIYLLMDNYKFFDTKINKVYSVYLNNNLIGNIDNKEKLYALIDEKQQIIKDNYNVSNVYPPNGLQVVENYTYNSSINNLDEVYKKIEETHDFTVLGYEVKFSETSTHKEFSIYVLDKDILNKALKDFILVFIPEEKFNDYMNGTQASIEDSHLIYESMGFIEDITIREKYISADAKIYENSEDLAQELLFGFNYKEKYYVVKEGDTIESVSEDHSLNTQEFLIANPKFSSKDSLLTLGEKVNVTLISPEISFAYDISELKQVTVDYNTVIERDNSKPSSYSEIKTPGVKGLSNRHSSYTVINGEPNNEVKITEDIIRPKVDEVVVKGKKVVYYYGNEYYNNDLGDWFWPTQQPFQLSSPFGYRWGKRHQGIDISGTGEGSKIFAANDGVVARVVNTCPNRGSYPNSCGGGYGNSVYINHGNNIYTVYAHMQNNIPVKEGQQVSRGQVIGYMSDSGQSKGIHLHFGYSIGFPGQGTYYDPQGLYKK